MAYDLHCNECSSRLHAPTLCGFSTSRCADGRVQGGNGRLPSRFRHISQSRTIDPQRGPEMSGTMIPCAPTSHAAPEISSNRAMSGPPRHPCFTARFGVKYRSPHG